MQILVSFVLLDIVNYKVRKLAVLNILEAEADLALIGKLTAHLGVERGFIHNDDSLAAFAYLACKLITVYNRKNSRGVGELIIARKLRRSCVKAEVDALPAEVAESFSRLASTDALLLHESLEFVHIKRHALVNEHFGCHIHGEAVGIIKLECVSAGEHGLALCLVLLEQAVVYLQAGVDGLCEAVLLAFNDAGYILLLFAQLGILALVFVNNGVDDLIKERLVNAQELTVTRSSSEKSAQDIATPLV